MKLIQLNTWNGRLERAITDFFKQEQADIICTQEGISLDRSSGLFLNLELMQAAAGLSYKAFGPAFSFKYMSSVAHYGNAILSRWPIQNSEVVFISMQYEPDYNHHKQQIANMRNFVHAVIKVDGKTLNVLTHHGYWIAEHKNGNSETLRQMEQLGDYIDDLRGPIILTGDFNLAPHSQSIGLISQRLRNLSVEHHLKTTRTALTTKSEVCDYIFVNHAIEVKKFYASDEVVSDHKALILDFEV